MINTTPGLSIDEDSTTNLGWGAYFLGLGPDTLLRLDRSERAATLHAGVTALEIEAIQEGRLILLEAATAAGLDIKALAWQAIRLA